MKTEKSHKLFERAKNVIPGGVNSPVRAFRAVGGNPLFIKRAEGAYLIDEDDNKYIELINSWGPMILGHANTDIENAVCEAVKDSLSFGAPGEREVFMAELITTMIPSIEKVRMVSSGTEATMAAVRLARGYTNRAKIIKFEGCYHGHGDSFLIAAGSGAITLGVPDSPGVTQGVANDTLTAPFNNLKAVQDLAAANKGQIAAIIIEPVAGNMGLVVPETGFLQGLRTLCDNEGIVLIFDEVMTGFRLSKGGAQQILNVKPDITTLGKIIGGGMPVGAYGGKKEIMDFVSPAGPVYQAGTLSGNPVAMAAGLAMLNYLNTHPEVYTHLENITARICEGFEKNLKELGIKGTVNKIGSMFTLFFTDQKVKDFETAKTSDTALFGRYFRAMLEEGVYLAPSQYESLFISTAITEELAEKIVNANYKALKAVLQNA
ncbi:glutamate-1-semialdehyde aminotransferase [Sporocytophaga myxococcoides]|uniref:Glutamate-1-semialdehyde 2,1-aminomutase n=1 Tax=Sporocytophaga myxococcoides TaxID=153721 RepID=A0A098LDN7_9BACT|nr:glutamate-1-semialdehyde 2,1-aminomutase [Sporocytophaga myxococcoides]GAL85091.1 glutamate-1-semialdehyde aminotransferase [Sporocytophaga myxococcoides]